MFQEINNHEEEPLQGNLELSKKYEELPIPTFYDYLLMQEKLAYEIRRQNKELQNVASSLNQMQAGSKALAESNQQVLDEIEDKFLRSEIDSDRSEEESFSQVSNEEAQEVLIRSLDALFCLVAAAQESTQAVLNLLPNSTGFWKPSPPAWKIQSEQILNGYVQGVGVIHDKLMMALEEIGLDVIIPKIEDPFSPHYHKAVEQIPGGTKGRIAKIIRYGYMRNGNVLRHAEVAVYKNY